MIRRLLLLLGAALVTEAMIFVGSNGDLVRLSRPVEALRTDPEFDDAARAALARRRISRRVLTHVADVARVRGDGDLRLEALRRVVRESPGDREARIALADGLRELGHFEEADAIYEALVDADPGATR